MTLPPWLAGMLLCCLDAGVTAAFPVVAAGLYRAREWLVEQSERGVP